MGTRIFNVRLSENEYAALARKAEGRSESMSGLVKHWITKAEEPVAKGPDKSHLQCDATIAELRSDVALKAQRVRELERACAVLEAKISKADEDDGF